MNKINPFVLIVFSALLLSISRLPLHMGFLVFVAPVPLMIFFDRDYHKKWSLFLAALIYSGIFTAIVLSWIGTVTVPGLFGIWMVHSIYHYLVFYAIQRVWRVFPKYRFLAFTVFFISLEYLLQFGESRFPWLNIGYALSDYGILLQVLDLIGLSGLSALIIVVGVLLYQTLKRGLRYLCYIALIMFVWVGYGLWRVSSLELEKHEAGIFVAQPSIPQDEKWDSDFYVEILNRYNILSAQAKADSAKLLILPEASFPVYLLRDRGQLTPLYQLIENHRLSYFAGFPDYLQAPSDHPYPHYYYNAAALFSEVGDYPEPYYKNILVPVGERMLWLDLFPFLWKLQFGQANWEFGKELKWFQCDSYEFSPSICYEIAFPELYHKTALPRRGSAYHKTDYLVNITNDAWFGTSYGPWLHGVMTRYRAVENRIQIYRSAQTGISMIVDPLGRTLAQTKLFEITNITAPLYISRAIPPIRKYYRYPLLICLIAAVIFILACLKPAKKEVKL